MNTKTIRSKIADFFLRDSLIPQEDFEYIYLDIQSQAPYVYKRGLVKNLLPNICAKSINFDKEIWRETESNYTNDPFLWLFTGMTHMRLKEYQKSIKLFSDFLHYRKGFCLNSFVIVKLAKLCTKSRQFDQLIRNIDNFSDDLKPEHEYIICCFKAYSYEMLGRYEEAKRIYNQIINFYCSSTLACSLWLMIINLQINEAIDKIDEVSIKYKENSQIFKDLSLLKAFALFRLGKFWSSAEILEKVWKDNKNELICAGLLGICYFKLGKLRKSFIYLLISAYTDKESPENWFNLAKIYKICGYECDAKVSDKLKKLNHGEKQILMNTNEEFIILPINFAKFCKLDETNDLINYNPKCNKARKLDLSMRSDYLDLNRDAILLCGLKDNKKVKRAKIKEESS